MYWKDQMPRIAKRKQWCNLWIKVRTGSFGRLLYHVWVTQLSTRFIICWYLSSVWYLIPCWPKQLDHLTMSLVDSPIDSPVDSPDSFHPVQLPSVSLAGCLCYCCLYLSQGVRIRVVVDDSPPRPGERRYPEDDGYWTEINSTNTVDERGEDATQERRLRQRCGDLRCPTLPVAWGCIFRSMSLFRSAITRFRRIPGGWFSPRQTAQHSSGKGLSHLARYIG